jgi:serine/threonine protein kinase
MGRFLEELERTDDVEELLRKWSAAVPELAPEFRDAVSFRPFSNVAAYTPEPPLDALPDFAIIRRIAAGGMGVVYEARQLSLKRHVAVKVRRGRLSARAQKRFRREQEVLARLHQTHIVPIHTSGQTGPWQYFAMAYIQGVSLNQLVHSTRERETDHGDGRTPTLGELADEVLRSTHGDADSRLPDAQPGVQHAAAVPRVPATPEPADKGTIRQPLTLSQDYFRSVALVTMQAAEALQHAHAIGVLHRDVKPGNMMVDTHGQCWLIDFGLAHCNDGARVSDESSESTGPSAPLATRGRLGTLEYMAPEQLKDRATEQSDVWGLGATLYELLTLRRAFQGRSDDEVEAKILHADPTPISRLVSNVPKDLVAICQKCLQKVPGKRYATMGEVAEDLRHWLKGEPTIARPLWVWQRIWLWARRNKGWAAAATLGVLTLFSLAGAAYAYALRQAEQTSATIRLLRMMEFQQLRMSTPKEAEWSKLAHV